MESARRLNLVPGDILFRKVFCYTRKDGDCWVHCVVRVVIQHFLKTIVVQFVFEVIG